MNIRRLAAAVIACSALSIAAEAQTGGSMSGPTTGGAMMQSHTTTTSQGCTNATNHMSGGAMASGNHMSGGTMSGGSMSGGSMSGGSTSGGGMSGTNHMAAHTNNCQPAPKSN
jgi:hypothetical protein